MTFVSPNSPMFSPCVIRYLILRIKLCIIKLLLQYLNFNSITAEVTVTTLGSPSLQLPHSQLLVHTPTLYYNRSPHIFVDIMWVKAFNKTIWSSYQSKNYYSQVQTNLEGLKRRFANTGMKMRPVPPIQYPPWAPLSQL